ncbi:MAG: oxidoreductase family protein [Planctomycetota bacterium]
MKSIAGFIVEITGAKSVELNEVIQNLWSGYGVIQRARLIGRTPEKVMIKHIDLSRDRKNRRGWSGDTSHKRKVDSYQVEARFYESYSSDCGEDCTVPGLVAARALENKFGWVIVMDDLDALGFNERVNTPRDEQIRGCLRWIASFHAAFLGNPGDGLWPTGTYWHLDTRPDEYAAMPKGMLKKSARSIDRRLNEARFQTLVHGDAKIANFCFSKEANVAAVDFQYVGRGCGMKDVAYFISSCLSAQEAGEQENALLEFYFQELKSALARREVEVCFDELEAEWRSLYPFAWADFCRFLIGWSPGHWKLHSYSKRLTQEVLDQIARE